LLIDILTVSKIVNIIIFVKGDHRFNLLKESLHRTGVEQRRILLTTNHTMDNIMDIMTRISTTDNYGLFWQKFFDEVTTVLNYDAPTVLQKYKWRITGGMDLHYFYYISIMDFSNQELGFGLAKFLSNSQELEELRLTPQPEIPPFLQDMTRTRDLYFSNLVDRIQYSAKI